MSQSDRVNELQAKWEVLLEEEERLFNLACQLDTQSSDKFEEKSAAVRAWWGATNAALWMFNRTRAQHNHELSPFPAFILGRLANISEELANGNVPSFVSDVAREGRVWWRQERHDIGFAVAYISAAKEGKISDRAYNKTVRQTYNVV